MSRMIDRRSVAMGRTAAPLRDQNQITHLGIHHSATTNGSNAIFENHWRSLGWTVGGYHEIILPNGDWELCYNPNQVTNGVGGHNNTTYHICVVGNFRTNGAQPSAAQMRVLLDRIRANVNRLKGVNYDRVLGHNEFPNTSLFNHRSNTCPGLNMRNIRNQARQSVQPTPPSNADMHRVAVRTGGFITADDAAAGRERDRRTWVEPGNYHVFRRHNGMINVSAKKGTPGSWINPSLPAQAPTPAIVVGSRVRVNNNAQRYVTGERIPTWVQGSTYTVQQIRNNNELLLQEITSWVWRKDVTLV